LLISPLQWNIFQYFLKNINLAKEYLEDILGIEDDEEENVVDIEEDDEEEDDGD
jgi:hypothetical protein